MAEQPKVLRVAILQGKKLVQERLIPAGQAVTVGTAASNTFVFPKTHLTVHSFVLFQPLKGRLYALNFTDGMASKLSKLKAGGVGTHLAKLKADPGVSSKGGVYTLPLTLEDKGKVVVEPEGLAVLFQFVDEPPQQAVKPIRAMDFRPRSFDEDDPLFLGFLAIWSALAVVFLIWVTNTEVVEYELEELPDRFTKLVVKKEEPKDLPEIDKSKDKIDPDKKAKGKEKAEKAKGKKQKSKGKLDDAKRKAALKRDIMKRSRLLNPQLIGTTGESQNFANNIWSNDGGLKDIDGALAESGGITMSTDEALRSGSGLDEGSKDIGDLGGIGGGTSDVGEVAVQVVASIQSEGEDLSEFEGDRGTMKKTVRKYQGQLKYCYEQRLKVVPSLQGRVEISWTVMNERASGVYVVSNQTGDAPLASCLTGKIEKWRFPAGLEGDVSWPFVFRASTQ